MRLASSEGRRLPLSWADSPPASTPCYRLSHLRRLRDSEQVAAVCYRVRSRGIEFLLVKTRNGRWTFPKGKAEPGLTHAQAAALEAFEEAGVHGRMEEATFVRYFRRNHGKRLARKEIAVNAHLCEVRRLDPPPEAHRNRTWFTPEKARQKLRQERNAHYGAELARVVDRAVARIQDRHGLAALPPALPANLRFIDAPRLRAGKTSAGETSPKSRRKSP